MKIDSLLWRNSQLEKELLSIRKEKKAVSCDKLIEIDGFNVGKERIKNKNNKINESKDGHDFACKQDARLRPKENTEKDDTQSSLTCLVDPFEILSLNYSTDNTSSKLFPTKEDACIKMMDRIPDFVTPCKRFQAQNYEGVTPMRRKKLFTPSSGPQSFSPTELDKVAMANVTKDLT